MKRFIIVVFLFLNCIYEGSSQKDTIKIGLLIQNKNSTAARHGAEMAVRKANLRNGSKYFILAVRDMEGPWGTGSRMAVDLVFGEKVWALIGSVDGRNSHLAEQVSAKTRVPFLSAWSGDPTLAYAFIPWYYCCVPGDQQKAAVIAGHLKAGVSDRTAIVSSKDYDSKISAEYFMKTAKEKGISGMSFFRFDKTGSIDSISHAIIESKIRNIVFFGPASAFSRLKKNLDSRTYRFVFLSYADGENPVNIRSLEGVTLISPGYLFTANGKKFRDEYLRTYGHLPGDASAYAFDMTSAVISSALVSFKDRDSLKNYLRKTDFEGVTGRISFDERGNRKGEPGLMTVRNGEFVRVER